MCSAPVTFGGGIAIEKFSSGVPSAGGWKAPLGPGVEDPLLDLARIPARRRLELLAPLLVHRSGDVSRVGHPPNIGLRAQPNRAITRIRRVGSARQPRPSISHMATTQTFSERITRRGHVLASRRGRVSAPLASSASPSTATRSATCTATTPPISFGAKLGAELKDQRPRGRPPRHPGQATGRSARRIDGDDDVQRGARADADELRPGGREVRSRLSGAFASRNESRDTARAMSAENVRSCAGSPKHSTRVISTGHYVEFFGQRSTADGRREDPELRPHRATAGLQALRRAVDRGL